MIASESIQPANAANLLALAGPATPLKRVACSEGGE